MENGPETIKSDADSLIPSPEILASSDQPPPHYRRVTANPQLLPEYRCRPALSDIHEMFSEVCERNPEILQIGPHYHIATSLQEPVVVTPIFANFSPQPYLLIVGQNKDGEIFGDRIATFEKKPDGYTEIEGNIITGIRNRKYATPIDIVFLRTLQLLANKFNQIMVWEIMDDSSRYLKRLKEPDRTQQSERWQALYNPGGKLGIEQYGMKFFDPAEPTDEAKATDVVLTRGDKPEGEIISKVLIKEGQEQLVRQNQLKYLKNLLEQIKLIISSE